MSSGTHVAPGSTGKSMNNRVMELEEENSRLQRLVAELLLKNQMLRDERLDALKESAPGSAR